MGKGVVSAVHSFISWAFDSVSTPAAKGVAFLSRGSLSDKILADNKGTEFALLQSKTGSQEKLGETALCLPLLSSMWL